MKIITRTYAIGMSRTSRLLRSVTSYNTLPISVNILTLPVSVSRNFSLNNTYYKRNNKIMSVCWGFLRYGSTHQSTELWKWSEQQYLCQHKDTESEDLNCHSSPHHDQDTQKVYSVWHHNQKMLLHTRDHNGMTWSLDSLTKAQNGYKMKIITRIHAKTMSKHHHHDYGRSRTWKGNTCCYISWSCIKYSGTPTRSRSTHSKLTHSQHETNVLRSSTNSSSFSINANTNSRS